MSVAPRRSGRRSLYTSQSPHSPTMDLPSHNLPKGSLLCTGMAVSRGSFIIHECLQKTRTFGILHVTSLMTDKNLLLWSRVSLYSEWSTVGRQDPDALRGQDQGSVLESKMEGTLQDTNSCLTPLGLPSTMYRCPKIQRPK